MFYRRVGDTPAKRHSQFRDGAGNLYHEQMQGQEGFTSNQSFLYHRRIPTAITSARAVETVGGGMVANNPLLPRHLRTQDLEPSGDAVQDRFALVGNTDLTMGFAVAVENSPLYRNGVADELVFVAAGSGVLKSCFGSLPVRAGDYVLVPTSTTHRWLVEEGPLRLLIIAATGDGHIGVPQRYLSTMGQMLDGSPYNERDVRVPEGLLEPGDGPVDVLVRTREGLTRYTYANHPFDVVGWDGYNYPWAFNIADFEPTTGSIHLPPTTYLTFEGPGFVVCSFVPRLFDYHPNALKVPYNHANVDSDELLFYWDGDFMSRSGSGIGPGSISLHPAGFIHGPQPGSGERSLRAERTDEYAVMVDTFSPVSLGEYTPKIEATDYPWSWARLDKQK